MYFIFTFCRIANYPYTVDEGATWWELKKAFTLWSDVSSLTFRDVGDSESERPPDIDISFVSGYHNDGSPFDGPGNISAKLNYSCLSQIIS